MNLCGLLLPCPTCGTAAAVAWCWARLTEGEGACPYPSCGAPAIDSLSEDCLQKPAAGCCSSFPWVTARNQPSPAHFSAVLRPCGLCGGHQGCWGAVCRAAGCSGDASPPSSEEINLPASAVRQVERKPARRNPAWRRGGAFHVLPIKAEPHVRGGCCCLLRACKPAVAFDPGPLPFCTLPSNLYLHVAGSCLGTCPSPQTKGQERESVFYFWLCLLTPVRPVQVARGQI